METTDKFMFDTNIFNKIKDGEIDIIHLMNNKNILLFATHVQRDELNNCKDEERRKKLLDTFNLIDSEQIPTESFILGASRLGMARLGDGDFFEKLRAGNIKHTNDALIGEVTIKNDLTLVTNDEFLIKKVKENLGKVIGFDAFLNELTKQNGNNNNSKK